MPQTNGNRPLTRLRRVRGARSQVYEALRGAIVSAELEPGRRLSENELAERLGVSRTPVREALIRLRDDRLVEIVPQLGTFVSHISDAGVQDAQFIRESLECSAIRLAAQRADRADVAALEGLIRRQEEVSAEHDFDRFYLLDDELHGALCELSGHGVAWSLAQRANGHLNRIRRLSLPQPHFLGEMVAEHRAVVEAVGRGEPDAAEAALRHHLRMVLSAVPAIRAEHPDYFEDETS
ncbi:MAG TPA: GntR family transcriptional regulator [Solirubrobacteraceae bacterium]|jgi:DNA-binding GntR family transcriptional regulator|nr:GntR family transcriptional regulator [Solirubrobacteraceae bacterium]